MEIGMKATAQMVVAKKTTAKAVGSGNLDVFATPMMVALMEEAACNCLANSLEPNQSSVGTLVNVSHTAASPIGEIITATATIAKIDGRKVTFTVTASDQKNKIGNGTHERFIIDAERFMAKLNS